VYLLCSDGLYDPLDEATIAAALTLTPAEACAQLVTLAWNAGGSDNLTGVVLRVCPDER
jgi:serine/threonine protein phosphatase PrpC